MKRRMGKKGQASKTMWLINRNKELRMFGNVYLSIKKQAQNDETNNESSTHTKQQYKEQKARVMVSNCKSKKYEN